MLTPRERLQACLTDNPSLDRPPVALWRHFPVDDQSPETLAVAVADFQRYYAFDLVKVTPASSYCVKDWGVEDVWDGDPEGVRRYTRRAVQQPLDWERLPSLHPHLSPSLSAQLSALRLIRSLVGPDVPVLMTIFSPLAQAKNLAGNEKLLAHLRQYPQAVLKGLETIAETTRRFVEASLETGIDGIFYAIQHAQASLLTLEEYRTFGLPFDRKVAEPAGSLWCNLLHLHGLDVYFDLVTEHQDFFPIVNWHDRETMPSLTEARKRFPHLVLCGGVGRRTLVFGETSEVRREVSEALQQVGGRRFILSTGCVVPLLAPHGNLRVVRESAERYPL